MSANKTSGSNRSDLIKRLRIQLGLTQEQYAAKEGMIFSTVNRWEAGRSQPSPLALREIEGLAEKVSKAKH